MNARRCLPSLAVLAWLCLPAAAHAATFDVNVTTDAAPVANACVSVQPCSLREAVAAANANADDDVINVPTGTITLTQGELGVTNPVTIAGAGARDTRISGGGTSRIFNFTGASARTVSGVTLTNGSAPPVSAGSTFAGDGGAVLVGQGTLTLSKSTVTASTAEMGGGGIAAPPEAGAAATLTVEESTVNGNQTGGGAVSVQAQGGGIMAGGTLSVTNSTISGNTVESTGIVQGGGIAATAAAVTLTNATIAGNTATGAAMSVGAGIQNVGTLDATNTIIAGNALTAMGTTSEGNCAVPAAGMTVANNLSSDASCGFAATGGIDSTDPVLAPLDNYGGPTDTRAIALTSPAANAGTATGCPATDQRGVARPQGAACDIGAFEAIPTAAGTGGGAQGGGTTPPVTPPRRTTAGRKPTLKVTGVPRSCRRTTFEIRLRSGVSGTGVKLRSVRVTLDQKKLKTVTRAGRFRVKVDAKKLKRGRHTLRVYATDSKGRVTSFKKSFTRCKAAKKRSRKG